MTDTDTIAAVASQATAARPLSANCRRLLALRAQQTRLQISGLALDLAHQAHPTVQNRQEMAAINRVLQGVGVQVSQVTGMLTEAEQKALAAYLNPEDEGAEARAVGGLLVPAGVTVH